MISITEDVLNRILLKLDTKSLSKLRCVCKYLHSLINSPVFVKMHYHDQFNNNPLVLVYWDKHLYCSLNFNGTIDRSRPQRVEVVSPFPFTPRFLGSCNGLLCLLEKDKCTPSLWNPTTKEYKELPPPLPSAVENLFGSNLSKLLYRNVAYGFGYDSIIDDYKVIQYENFTQYGHGFRNNKDDDYSTTEFQVYTLGTDTWTRINDSLYESDPMPPYQYQHHPLPGMFVSGALHWIVMDKERPKIIAFDIEKEMFLPEVPKPHTRHKEYLYHRCSLHVLRGCLCIYEELGCEYLDVWMMKEYGVKDSWTKLCAIKNFCGIRADAFLGLNLQVLNFCDSGEVLVFLIDKANKNKLILYDPITMEHRPVMVGGEIGGICYQEIHTESFVSLNTGIYMYGKVKNKHSDEIKMKRKRLQNGVHDDY